MCDTQLIIQIVLYSVLFSRNKFTINSAKTCCDPLNGMTEGQNVKNQ